MTALRSLERLRLRAIGLLAAMFIAGALAGAGLTRALGPRGREPPPPPGMMLYAHLGLDREQEARARAIFEAHRPELDAVLRDALPRARAIQDAIDREMRAYLTPEQARRLDEMKAAPPPPGGPRMPGMGPMGPAGPGPGRPPPPGMPGPFLGAPPPEPGPQPPPPR